ncbi:UNVERIFIED_ORG: hypothetical protein BDU10_7515 [Burkholderia sp. CF145]|jgi:hypothetical protein|uniref:hypothetical protein n=1 Tax=Paraburkholderia hospita TaxID=169430 RepID=UPI0002715849|nr:hypothetical protein [Paraburkholderia hospita]EUC17707.1 hypothetical protein PMI06_000271 [Burkholderia sp. BT03]SKD03824.1 hypothetical protein SAMN06266956_8466 [Paraburkholderia hospita]
MKTNKAMRNLLSGLQLNRSLSPSLKAVADNGFVHHNGCYVLRDLSATTNATRSTLGDSTGYECFVNSLHIEDYEADQPLAQAILFVMQVFQIWNAAAPNKYLTAIVSAGEFSVVAKFHVKRPDEHWLSDNIEGYDDPVLSIDSNEDISAMVSKSR